MSEALTGTPPRGPSLAEQANSRRIGRSTFIGHSAGYLVMIAIVVVVLSMTGFAQSARYHAIFAVTDPPVVIDEAIKLLVPWAMMGLAVLATVIWTDLGVRRRHDRGRSGVDVVIFQMLFLATLAVHAFANAPDIIGWLDAALVLYALYLFVVLALLPGTPQASLYGPAPKSS